MSAISAATPTQLTTVRAKRQAAQLYAVAITPPIVFAAQINGTPASLDSVVSITFDNVTTGAYTDIVADMMLWIGSAPGLHDIGQARLRSATSSILTIGEESEVRLANNQYLSALPDFALWPKHIAVANDGTAFMDGNIAYSDQNANHTPIVIMSTHAVKEITGASVSSLWDASDSWCPGSTIASYAWTCVGGTIDDSTSATPVIDFDQPGEYLVECEVTAANGKTAIGYRWVVVWSKNDYYDAGVATVTRSRTNDVVTLDIGAHTLSNGDIISIRGMEDASYDVEQVAVTVIDADTITYPCVGDDESTQSDTGGMVYKLIYLACLPSKISSFDGSVDYQRGGVEFTVQMYAGASTADIRERALVIVFADDYYDGVLGSVGQIPDRENIVCNGWISAENLDADKDGGMVEFTVSGPQYWLGAQTSFPLGIENAITTPAAWTEMQDLTIDKALAHFSTWRSTLAKVCDVYPGGDTRLSPACTAATESLWAQLTEFTERQILARPCTDQYGRVFVEVDTQFIPAVDRTTIPIIMTLQKSDITGKINLPRITTPACSRIELSGVSVASGSTDTPTYFSLAPGHVFKHFGQPEPIDRMLLSSQAQANQLAGLILGQRNNEFPSIDIDLSENNRLISVCPRQMIAVDITSDMTPRGTTYNGNLIPRSVTWSYQGGSLVTSSNCEAETFEDISCNGDIPVLADDGTYDFSWTIPAFPTFPPFRPSVIAPIPTPRPIVPLGIVAVYVFQKGLYFTKDLASVSPTWTLTTPLSVWSQAELNSIVHFKLNQYGRAFLASQFVVWSNVVGLDPRNVVGSQANFETIYRAADYAIAGIGVIPNVDNKVGVYTGGIFTDNNRGSAQYLQASATSLAMKKQTWQHGQGDAPPTLPKGDMSYYDGHWYASYFIDMLSYAHVRRMSADLATWEYLYSVYIGGYQHAHAAAADIMYYFGVTGEKRTNLAATSIDLGVGWDTTRQSIACDPTGQYVMGFIGGTGVFVFKKSVDFGANWTTIGTFPHTIEPGHCKILNMGDANTWLVFSKEHTTNLLKVHYTADFGVTWSSKLGNLATLTSTTAAVVEAHYA